MLSFAGSLWTGLSRGFGSASDTPFKSLAGAGALFLLFLQLGLRASDAAVQAIAFTACGISGLVCVLVVLRSATRQVITSQESENHELRMLVDQLRTENQSLATRKDELVAVANDLATADDQLSRELRAAMLERDRGAAYFDHIVNLLIGLRGALTDPVFPDHGVDLFLEQTVLASTRDAIKIQNSRTGQAGKVELGIARQQGHEVRVTHAAGPYMEGLKRAGPCYSGAASLKAVLARKAAADFVENGYAITPFTLGEEDHFLVALADSQFDSSQNRLLDGIGQALEVSAMALSQGS